MLKEELFESFIESIYTIESFRRRLAILTSYLETSLFVEGQSDITLEAFLEFSSVQSTDSKFFQSLERGFYKAFHRGNYRNIINYFEERIDQYPTIRLVLAFFPLEVQQKIIAARLEDYLGFPVILDIFYDEHLIAGCKIAWQGRMADFSFNNVIEKKRKEIVDYLSSKYE